jgi:hypothetical protein
MSQKFRRRNKDGQASRQTIADRRRLRKTVRRPALEIGVGQLVEPWTLSR